MTSGITTPDEHPADTIIDLEEYAKAGREVPPHAAGRGYRIRIDKTPKVLHTPTITGEEILGLVGKSSIGYRLDMKLRGGQTKKIEPAEVVDLTARGVEKFMTLALDATEGGSEHEDRSPQALPARN